MAEITAALDEQGANALLDAALQTIGTVTKTGSGSLGPFTATYTFAASFTNGIVDLIPANTIRIPAGDHDRSGRPRPLELPGLEGAAVHDRRRQRVLLERSAPE